MEFVIPIIKSLIYFIIVFYGSRIFIYAFYISNYIEKICFIDWVHWYVNKFQFIFFLFVIGIFVCSSSSAIFDDFASYLWLRSLAGFFYGINSSIIFIMCNELYFKGERSK